MVVSLDRPHPIWSHGDAVSIGLGNELRVSLTNASRRSRMTAICAHRTTGIDGFVARTIARSCLTGKMAHDDLVRPATGSRLQSSGTPLALCPLHTKP